MNPEALERLYDTYAEPLFRYLCSLVHSEAEAKDRLQDLFLKVARNPGCLEGVDHVKAYLFRLAHNLAVDAIRRGGSRQAKHDRLAAEPLPLFADAADPDISTCRQSMARTLAELLDCAQPAAAFRTQPAAEGLPSIRLEIIASHGVADHPAPKIWGSLGTLHRSGFSSIRLQIPQFGRFLAGGDAEDNP